MPRPALNKRTPRACEHCRQTRRRCEPPYPCRQCIAAGISCHVRAKARPQRRHRLTAPIPRNDDHRIESVGNDASNGELVGHGKVQLVSEAQRHSQNDTFELLKSLVQNMLLERHDYALNCSLLEPPLRDLEATNSSFPLLAQSNTRVALPLTSVQTWNLLADFQKFMGWQDAQFVNIEALHATAINLVEHLLDLSPSFVSMTVTANHLPVDSVALMFGALALGAVATGEFECGRFYFDISTEVVKHFRGQSTLELCLALFLQHTFALRIGTLSYAQSIIVQAIQNAHDLGLHHNTHGIQGLQLYLLIYMADQYCSLTHNTKPIIRTSDLQDQLFAPLSDAKPQLQTLIDLVTINGYIIEQSSQLQSPSQTEIFELEAKIGGLCSRLIRPVPIQSSCGGFRTLYEPLARVHMLCCRLKLRSPGLSEQISWLPSLCICMHAAEGVLLAYYELYRPVLAALVNQSNAQNNCTGKFSMPIVCKLPTTWRQVKRIMMSVFVVVFAYEHGEMVHEEASRYVAMARLLFEYPRWRWGEELDEALQTLVDISKLYDFRLYDHTQTLLPGANEQFLRPFKGPPQIEVDLLDATHGTTADPIGMHDEGPSRLGPWYNAFNNVSVDDLFESDFDTFQNQALFGLWETIECPV